MSDLPIPERHRKMPENPAVIEELNGVLSEDKRRVRVNIVLSNGTTHPDLELILNDANELELSRTSVFENFGPGFAFTMHIRQPKVKFPLSLTCQVNYLDDQVYSEKKITIDNI